MLKRLSHALYLEINGKTADDIRVACEDKTSRAHLIQRALLLYFKARDTVAPRFGLIGVGCISFADARLATFVRRTGLVI